MEMFYVGCEIMGIW